MSSQSRCTKVPRIIQLDRHEFKHDFEPKRPYLLLSIRRPGSRFAQREGESQMISRCDLMLHEWDQDQPPYPLPPVVFQARQALKVAEWLSQHLAVLAEGDCDFVIQSEEASSQRSALSDVIESILHWEVADRGSVSPHAETTVLLEMALAYRGIAGALHSMRGSKLPVAADAQVLGLISAIFATLNVDFIISKDLQPHHDDAVELSTAVVNNIAGLLGVEFGDTHMCLEIRDFIAGVIKLRQTQCCVSASDVNFMKLPADVNKHSAILYVGEFDVETLSTFRDEFTGSIQLLMPVEAETIGIKSRLLHRYGSLLETQLGPVRLFSVARKRDLSSECLHSRLRTTPRNQSAS